MKWVVLALALIQGAWLTIDGARALMVGDYITPGSGPRAGQLGPWSRVVSAFGLEPRSPFIKIVHVCLGIFWFVGIVTLLIRPDIGWWVMLGCGIATVWYLPLGTVMSIVVLVLLFMPQLRGLS